MARSGRARGVMVLLTALTVATAHEAGAQGRGRGNDDRGRSAQGIPPGHLPRAGECRVWYDNRPPGQQPSPTSCANARATVARSGGRVIYGDAARRDDGRDDRRDDRARGDDDGRREKKCKAKDREKGKCGDTRVHDDGRYPDRTDDRYPDRSYPRSLPEMVWGVMFGRGERTNEIRQWVGAENVRASYTDADRNGTPEAVTWTNHDGQIVQRWIDDDRDGRADRVALYQNNRVVRVIQ